jgi:hypothetical protein
VRVNPHPDPGPIPAGPSLRLPIAATVVLVTLWAIFTFFAWPLSGPIGAIADDVEERLGLDLNPGKPKKPDEAKKADTDAPATAKPRTVQPR